MSTLSSSLITSSSTVSSEQFVRQSKAFKSKRFSKQRRTVVGIRNTEDKKVAV